MTDPLSTLRTAVTALPVDRQDALQEVLAGGIDVQLQQAIAGCGTSIYELSQQSGVSAASIHRFVKGERGLILAVAAKLAKALGLELAKPGKGHRPAPRIDIQPAIDAAVEVATADLRDACRAAARLFRPPYRRGMSGIALPPQAGEQADWDRLRAALVAAGVEIGEELT